MENINTGYNKLMNEKKTVVGVTGANGFIGSNIVNKLRKEGFRVISLQRTIPCSSNDETRVFDLCKLDTINEELLYGIDILIHNAALVHKPQADKYLYKTMNFEATKKLYELSTNLNIKKFIFLSTVGVYGKNSYSYPIDINFPVSPKSEYGVSKLDSENYLLHKKRDREDKEFPKISILRLPLVVGKNAPGNYGLLEKLSKLKFPLPFGSANNQRTVVSIDMVVDTITQGCLNLNEHLGINLLGNDIPISTKQLIISLRAENGLKPNLFPIPKLFMKFFLSLIGKRKIYEQLYEDLVFNNSTDKNNN